MRSASASSHLHQTARRPLHSVYHLRRDRDRGLRDALPSRVRLFTCVTRECTTRLARRMVKAWTSFMTIDRCPVARQSRCYSRLGAQALLKHASPCVLSARPSVAAHQRLLPRPRCKLSSRAHIRGPEAFLSAVGKEVFAGGKAVGSRQDDRHGNLQKVPLLRPTWLRTSTVSLVAHTSPAA